MTQTDLPHTITDFEPGEHLCCIYETEEEHRAVLTPFLRQGLTQSEKIIYIMDVRTAETILSYLRDDGLKVEPYLANGQLSILTCDDAYMREGVFDPDRMIALLRTETERALVEGYSALRVTGEMTWALRGLPGSERLIEYEAKLNEFFPGSKCLALCQYDRRRFKPEVLLDVLRTHPIVVVGTKTYDNFYYIPPAELLDHNLPATELRHWMQNLAERKEVEEEIKRRNEELSALNAIATVVNQSLGLKEVLDAALKKTMEVLSVEGGLIYLFDEISQTFAPAAHHGISQDVLREVTGFKIGEGLSGRVAESGKALVVADLAVDPRNISPTASREGLHSYAGVPVNYKGKVIGVMTLVTRKAGHFKPNHVNLLNHIGSYIGVAIENARLYEEIKRLAEEMRESEEKYRNLFEYANDSIFILDPSTRRFLDVNENAAERLGYTHEELMELTLDNIAPSYSVERIEANIRELQKGGSITFETVHRRKDGTEMPVEISSRLIEYGGRKVVQGFARDITERKQAEKERKRLLNELEEKNKELEQIVYIASHDLRSPLLNIQGFSRELENSIKQVYSVLHTEDVSSTVREKLASFLDEDIPEALQYILASTSKMDSLLSGLLRLSRLGREALTIQQLDMNRLMSDVAGAFEFQIKEKDVTLQIETLPSCSGDGTQINQVFSNLVDNALKYLDPNRPGIIRISGRKEEGQAVYCVEDNGIGIAAEYQDKIYEIFHRLNPEASAGEGLGLTIARRILDRHGGKIWAESEPGEGSKFFVSLPAI
ncbi:TPA: PAS domain S-box protein [Candidatus Poribacteria bacterium]|nr:PAS domain S-box protein [Candidatus Poribacteria bacterium]